MALNNDIIDLTAAAGAADEHVVGGRVNGASGNLELDMNIGGTSAIQIPLLNNMPPDEHVTGARYNPGTGEVELDLCIAGARAITFPLLNQLPRDVYITNGIYDPSTMIITMIYSDGRKNLDIDLSTIVMYEKAGANYDPTHEYNTGDVVSIPGSSILYIALTSGILPDPPASSVEWKPVSMADDIEPERGGIVWDATIEYKARDIVTVGSSADVFIAINDNVNSDPLNRTDWFELGNSRHNVGLFTPTAGAEYPDPSTEEEGAVWYTTGLPPEGYPMTTGPFLGYTLKNNDKYVWYGLDVAGDDIWLWEPFPRIAGIERGGIQWKDSKDYFVDDIVAFGQVIYIANTDNNNVNPVTGSEWTALSLDERGGLAYNDTSTYNVGDIVSHNGTIYAAVNPVPPGHTPPDSAYWNTPTYSEIGGKIWSSTVSYFIGDIVTDGSDGKVYTALNNTTGDTPSISPGIWQVVGDNAESGGIIWKNDINFNKGDLATDPDTYPALVYISLNSGNLNNDLTDTSWWLELDSIFYNAPTGGRDATGAPNQGVLHNPNNPTDEYPDISQEHEGAIWYITGLGTDSVTGDKIKYEFTTGPLTGIKVVDLDRIVWIDTNQGTDEPEWLWSPFPRIKAEVGGVAWRSGLPYDAGDTVTHLSKLWITNVDTNPGDEPGIAPAWRDTNDNSALIERGGLAWDASKDYAVGDIVSDPTATPVKFYACEKANTGEPVSEPQYWGEINSIFYSVATYNPSQGVEYPDTTGEMEGATWYVWGLGDDATTGDPIRYEMQTGDLAGIYVADGDRIAWVYTMDDGTPRWAWFPLPRVSGERGGVAWRSGANYSKGDIVIDLKDFRTYKSTVNNNLGNTPSNGDGPWDLMVDVEQGGVAWAATSNYVPGDIVSAPDGHVYKCNLPNKDLLPSGSTAEWEQLALDLDGIASYVGGRFVAACKIYDNSPLNWGNTFNIRSITDKSGSSYSKIVSFSHPVPTPYSLLTSGTYNDVALVNTSSTGCEVHMGSISNGHRTDLMFVHAPVPGAQTEYLPNAFERKILTPKEYGEIYKVPVGATQLDWGIIGTGGVNGIAAEPIHGTWTVRQGEYIIITWGSYGETQNTILKVGSDTATAVHAGTEHGTGKSTNADNWLVQHNVVPSGTRFTGGHFRGDASSWGSASDWWFHHKEAGPGAGHQGFSHYGRQGPGGLVLIFS